MILNASHEITLSGLPSDIFDAYVRYKKGTRAIVSWIVQYRPSKYIDVKRIPVSELATIADSIAGVLKELPDVIHFHFRETIAARKRLSNYFRSHVDKSPDDAHTSQHEHFTSILDEIYAVLCSRCDKARSKSGVQPQNNATDRSRDRTSNHFQALDLDQTVAENESVHPNASLDSRTDSSDDEAGAEVANTATGGLSDDGLEKKMMLVGIYLTVRETITDIRALWIKVAKQELHFVAASFATNIGLDLLGQMETILLEHDAAIELSQLPQLCQLRQLCPSPVIGPADAPDDSQAHLLFDQLAQWEHTFESTIQKKRQMAGACCPDCHRDMSQEMPLSGETISATPPMLGTLADDILRMILCKKGPCSIVRDSSPVYADVGYWFSHPSTKDNEMQLAFGMQALVLSYGPDIDMNAAVGPAQYRLSSLRLAQHAKKSVEKLLSDAECFPCRCPQTLSLHLQNFDTELTAFMKHKCWDLYSRSPWVAGNHALEILDICHYYGLKLFEYRQYVRAVVHVYNILQQLAGMGKIPILEAICDKYSGTFFPGGLRPSHNFKSCWLRSTGARLKFKKNHQKHSRQDSWCMAITPHAARKAAGLGVCSNAKENRKGCHLFKIKQQDYHLTDAQWKELSSGPIEGDANLRHSDVVDQDCQHHRLPSILPEINSCLSSPCTNLNANSALLDHFSVFDSCIRIITSVSDAVHAHKTEKGMKCLCFTSALLTSADRIVGARKMGKVNGASWTKDEREGLLEVVMKVMREELGGKDVKEWCWEI